MSSDNATKLTPSGVCSPTQPNSFPPHVPLVQRQFDCEDQAPRKPDKNKHIGHIYEWSNGERLDPNIDCHLTIGGETTIHKLANGKDLFCEAPPGEYKAELLQNFDEQKLTTARQELKDALDAIIKHEEAEAAALQKIQDQQSAFSNALDLTGSAVSGFFLSGVGLIKDTKAWSDLINPFNHFANAAISAWNAKSSNGKSWVESFANNYSEAQKNDLVKALGFDPSKIKPEDLAQAFEIACFVYEDAPSQELLKNFSITYVKAQHRREWAKVAGAAVFEIVLAALLIVFTAGVGLAARAAGSISTKLLGLLKKLGEVLKKLGAWLRSYRIKSNGTVRGISGNEAAPVIIPRPAPLVMDDITPSKPALRSSDATSVNAAAALKAKTSGLQSAQQTAATTKTLPDGRIRYYDEETLARKEGPTRGASFVTEYNPKTGFTRQWMESYDHSGNVNRVHPKSINGQTLKAQHYPPTGAELESWK